jgi:hypothetical protein
VWKELAQDFPEVFDQYVEQTLWNSARDTELRRPLTQTEEIRRKKGIPHEQIDHDRLWNKRLDGIAFKIPTKTKSGVIYLLEFKRMSDVTNQYIIRSKHMTETVVQYTSLGSGLVITMQRQGWKVEQVSFIVGARSLNEKELKKNFAYFKIPSASVEPIELDMKIFDEYTNILKGMYSIRFNGRSDHRGTSEGSVRPVNRRSNHGDTPTCPAWGSTSPLLKSLTT